MHTPPSPMRWRTGPRPSRTPAGSRRTSRRPRSSRRPRRCLGEQGRGLHPPVWRRMRSVSRRPPMMLGPGRVSRRPRMLPGRCSVGRCRRSSAELPKIAPRWPVSGPPGRRPPRSWPSDSRWASIVRKQSPMSGREGTEPRAPPMSRLRAPFHQRLTSGHGKTGLWPRAVGTQVMTVRMRTGRRRLSGANQGRSGGRPRRWRVGSGPIRRVWRQGRSGRPKRAPPRRRRSRRRRSRELAEPPTRDPAKPSRYDPAKPRVRHPAKLRSRHAAAHR